MLLINKAKGIGETNIEFGNCSAGVMVGVLIAFCIHLKRAGSIKNQEYGNDITAELDKLLDNFLAQVPENYRNDFFAGINLVRDNCRLDRDVYDVAVKEYRDKIFVVRSKPSYMKKTKISLNNFDFKKSVAFLRFFLDDHMGIRILSRTGAPKALERYAQSFINAVGKKINFREK